MIKVLLADDHRIVRQGLRSMVEKEPDMVVVAEASSGLSAIQLAREHLPDVVVMDISMNQMDGVEATRVIARDFRQVKVLALSMESDRHFVVEALKAGALGYLLKDVAFEELAAAIRHVAANETYISPRISDILVRDYLQRIPEEEIGGASASSSLTPRERKILQAIADGRSSKEIAFQFKVSLKTVENQRLSIMKKLDLYSVAELTKYAVRAGLTRLK